MAMREQQEEYDRRVLDALVDRDIAISKIRIACYEKVKAIGLEVFGPEFASAPSSEDQS